MIHKIHKYFQYKTLKVSVPTDKIKMTDAIWQCGPTGSEGHYRALCSSSYCAINNIFIILNKTVLLLYVQIKGNPTN